MAKNKNQRMELHDFYCLNCGNKGIGLMRKYGSKRETFHRKKLYCIYCKEDINHIECQTLEQVEEFKQNFTKGVYVNEAKESVDYVRSARLG